MPKKFKDWGVVNFLQDKIGDVGKEIVDVVARGESPLKAATDLIFGDKGGQLTEAEKKQALELARIDHEQWMASVKDRQHARETFTEDNSLHKIYAYGFGGAYIVLTLLFLWIGYKWSVDNVEVNEFVITLVSTLFGAMSSKVNTITDFLFGSSSGSKEKSRQLDNLTGKLK